MPAHIAGPVAPVVDWMKNVSHRNAPGAMSAIAFIVRPVRPRVGCSFGSLLSAMSDLLLRGPLLRLRFRGVQQGRATGSAGWIDRRATKRGWLPGQSSI